LNIIICIYILAVFQDSKNFLNKFFEFFKFWKQVNEDPEAGEPSFPAFKNKQEAGMATQYSEEDIKKAKEEEAAKVKAEMLAEFAEKEARSAAKTRKQGISDWCDVQVEKGVIAPAWIKAGLKEFMESCDAEEEITFSEEKKGNALDWIKDFIEGFPKLVDFKEVASREKDVGAGDAGTKLEKFIRDKMEKKPELGYNAAFAEVQKEYPELVTEYISDMKGE